MEYLREAEKKGSLGAGGMRTTGVGLVVIVAQDWELVVFVPQEWGW